MNRQWVQLWDLRTKSRVGEPWHNVHGAGFSPDGKMLATAGEDHTIRLWDVESQQPIGEPLRGHTDTYSLSHSARTESSWRQAVGIGPSGCGTSAHDPGLTAPVRSQIGTCPSRSGGCISETSVRTISHARTCPPVRALGRNRRRNDQSLRNGPGPVQCGSGSEQEPKRGAAANDAVRLELSPYEQKTCSRR